MGYTTDFTGEIEIDPPLNDSERTFLEDFSRSRRMIRKKGPLFVGGSGYRGQDGDDDVIDHNRPNGDTPYEVKYLGAPLDPTSEFAQFYEPDGQPGLWCQWVPTEDGAALEWDGGEKFYYSAEWMKYLVTKLLHGDSARAYVSAHVNEDERLKDFTFDHVLNGVIRAEGEDSEDRWMLVVEDSVVKVANAVITFETAQEV